MNDMNQMKSCYGMLAETYERAGQNQKAMYYFGFYRDFHEKIVKQKEQQSKQNVDEANLKLNLIESEKKNQELELKLKQSELIEISGSNTSLRKTLTRKELQLELLNREHEITTIKYKHEQENVKNATIKHRNEIIFALILVGLLLTIVIFVIKSNIERRKHNNNYCQQ